MHAKSLPIAAMVLVSPHLIAAETSYTGGADVKYKYDDNIRLSPSNQIDLQGFIGSVFVKGKYATERLETTLDIDLDWERYTDAGLDTNNPDLIDPKASEFDSDNQDIKGDIRYQWETHQLFLGARYWRDSTLNTAFTDTGNTGLALEGATRRTEKALTPGWGWQLTERQRLQTNLLATDVSYESTRFVDYDYVSLSSNWSYLLTERIHLQLEPYYSGYENVGRPINELYIRQADGSFSLQAINLKVRQSTYGVRAGFIWQFTEKLNFNVLLGGANTTSKNNTVEFDSIEILPGFVVVPVFQEVNNKNDSNGFVGDMTLDWKQETYGLTGKLSSTVQPTGDGIVRNFYEGKLNFFWQPAERMKLDINALLGQSESTDGRLEDKRTFSELGIRYSYQFAEHWWMRASYRYRIQDFERNDGEGKGNAAYLTISYRLPKAII